MGGSQDRLILASTSPQRQAILEQLQIPFEVVAPTYVEDDRPGPTPEDVVRRHAAGKARSVHRDGRLTLGVDTAVVLDGLVYGKPEDRAAASHMLAALSGRTHAVVSGVCLFGSGLDAAAHEVTEVTFRPLTPDTVDLYLESGEWEGRAGGYAIQGLGGRLVRAVEGDYLNVVGLPGALLLDLLERHAPNLLETRR
jgi:septum formation protein